VDHRRLAELPADWVVAVPDRQGRYRGEDYSYRLPKAAIPDVGGLDEHVSGPESKDAGDDPRG
jgi:hypothetical protein